MRNGAPSLGVVVLAAVVAAPEERANRPAAVLEFGGDDAAGADRPRRRRSAFRRRPRSGRRGAGRGRNRCRRRTRRPSAASRHRAGRRRPRRRTATCGSRPWPSSSEPRSARAPTIASSRSPSRAIASRVAVAGVEMQREQPAVVVGLDVERLARAQLVERPRGRVGAQEFQRRGIVDTHAREHAADRVAAPDAIVAPIAGLGAGVDDRQRGERQVEPDESRRHRLRRRPGTRPKAATPESPKRAIAEPAGRATGVLATRRAAPCTLCARIRVLCAVIADGLPGAAAILAKVLRTRTRGPTDIG